MMFQPARKTEADQAEKLPFRIVEYRCSLNTTDYSLSLETQLNKEQLYEFLRTRLVPLPLSGISEIPGGFKLQYTEHANVLAGHFFCFLFTGQLTGMANPLQYALDELGATSCSQLEPELLPTMKSELISEYYRRIDAKDVAWVLNLFSEDAIYRRGETEFVGKDQIAYFYNNGRKIEGVHRIDEPIISDSTVIIRGRFIGTGVAGASKDVGFTDMWTFDGYKVSLRETYLALGSSYVRE